MWLGSMLVMVRGNFDDIECDTYSGFDVEQIEESGDVDSGNESMEIRKHVSSLISL